MRGALGRQLVEPFLAAHDPGSFGAEQSQGVGKDRAEVGRVDAEDHGIRSRRVDQRAEGVEDGREAELATDGANEGHRGMMQAGVEEQKAGGVTEFGDVFGRYRGHGNVERDEKVG
jgi:hypothetical protein